MKKWIVNKNIDILVILYLTAYGLPIFNFSMRNLLGIILWGYLVIEIKRNDRQINLKSYIVLLSMIILQGAYVSLVADYYGNEWKVISFMIYWLVDFISVSLFVSLLVRKRQLDIIHIVDILLINANIQGVLAVIGYFVRPLQNMLNQYMVTANVYDKNVVELTQGYRMFGLSVEFFFSMPILQMFLAVLAFYLGLFYHRKYFLLAPLPAFSAVINARVSLVVAILGIFILCIFVFKGKVSDVKKRLFILSFFLLFLLFLLGTVENAFINDGIAQIKGLLVNGSNQKNTIGYLLNDMWVFPQGLQILSGYGIRIMGVSKYGAESDVGYANDMWMGGIIYVIMIWIMVVYIIGKFRNMKNNKDLANFLVIFSIMTLVFCNIKGQIIGPNMFFLVLFILFGVAVAKRDIKNDA